LQIVSGKSKREWVSPLSFILLHGIEIKNPGVKKMSEDLAKGLFLANKLNPFREAVEQRYCRILGMSIYTIQKKVSERLVAYKVGYWDEEPKTEEDFKKVKTFRSDSQGTIVFSFTVNHQEISEDDLYYACVKHFKDNLLSQSENESFEKRLAAFKEQSAGRSAPSKIYFGSVVKVFDIYHKSFYLSQNGKYPELVENKLYYRGNYFKGDTPLKNFQFGDKDYITVSTEYKLPLYDIAIKHFDTVATNVYCQQQFIK